MGGANEWSAIGSDCETALAISDGEVDGLDDDEDEGIGNGKCTTAAVVGVIPPIEYNV